jgi:hypothetical protein
MSSSRNREEILFLSWGGSGFFFFFFFPVKSLVFGLLWGPPWSWKAPWFDVSVADK